MDSRRRPWTAMLLVLTSLVLLSVALGFGLARRTRERGEPYAVMRSDQLRGDELPSRASASPRFSIPVATFLNPRNPSHLFLLMPAAGTLALLPLAALYGLIWWTRLRRSDDDTTRSYESGSVQATEARFRHLLFGFLLWMGVVVLLIFDLLGAVSLYPRFIAVYAAFWSLVGAILLHDRPLRESTFGLGVFLVLIFSLRFVDWNSRKPFLRAFHRIEKGMTEGEVQRVMEGYPRFTAPGATLDEEGDLVSGSVSYTHTQEAWGDSDVGLLRFEGSRVVEVAFLPD